MGCENGGRLDFSTVAPKPNASRTNGCVWGHVHSLFSGSTAAKAVPASDFGNNSDSLTLGENYNMIGEAGRVVLICRCWFNDAQYRG